MMTVGPHIFIDFGTSYSVTPLEFDFIEGAFVKQPTVIDQLSSKSLVAGEGQSH